MYIPCMHTSISLRMHQSISVRRKVERAMQTVFEWYLKINPDGKVVVVEKYGWCQEKVIDISLNSLIINEDSIVFRQGGVLHRCYFKNYILSSARYPSQYLLEKGLIKSVQKSQLSYLYDLITSYVASKQGVLVSLKDFDVEALKAAYPGYCEYVSDVDALIAQLPKR